MAEKWGHYQLLAPLAKGGMAEVFKAVSLDSSGPRIPLCIKRIRSEYTDDPEFVRMFEQEARIATALQHPNIVKVFDWNRHDGQLYLAMEFVDGLDLKEILIRTAEQGSVPPVGFALYVFEKLLRALIGAQERTVEGQVAPVIHRDVSPHNILVSRTGEVKLTDFGIAKAKGSTSMTRTGVIKGKLAYLAPEQANGEEVEPSADLYCAGLVLFELLVGERLRTGRSEQEILVSVIQKDVPRLGWLSESLNAYMGRLLARRPRDRFAFARDALDAFLLLERPPYSPMEAGRLVQSLARENGSVCNEETFRGKTVLSDAKTPSGQTEPPAQTALRPEPERSRDRKRMVSMGIILGGLLVGILAAGGAMVRNRTQEEVGATTDTEVSVSNPAPAAQTTPAAQAAPVAQTAPAAQTPSEVVPASLVQFIEDDSDDPGSASGPIAPSLPDSPSLPVPAAAVKAATAEPTATARSEGTLEILCRPWARVTVDGKPVGITPVARRSMPPGRYRVTLSNPELSYNRSVWVKIRPGQNTRIVESIPLTDGPGAAPVKSPSL